MRGLRRPEVALPTMSGAGRGAAQAAADLQAKMTDPNAKLEFPDHWNKSDVRGALYAMHGWVCAYCQCELPRNDRGDVEHYRPKKASDKALPLAYWWLAYTLENYFLACRVCNSGRKGGRFPLELGATPVTYASRNNLASEARLLADPAIDSVEEWMRVDWMDPTYPGRIKAVPALDEGSSGKTRATNTIQFFRLNEDPELYRNRLLAIMEIARAHKADDRESAQRLASRYFPHGMAARNYLEDNDPTWLPSRRDELRFLLEEIDGRLRNAVGLLGAGPDDLRLCRKIIEELCWSLAVLWKDPPPATFTSDEIEAWLQERDWISLVALKCGCWFQPERILVTAQNP